ncbi:MAG: hypothetical protein RR998_06985 [Oscillospiraceae bacterium]
MRSKHTLLALTLAILLAALPLAACAYNPENVLTVDGESIPAGRYLSYQMAALSSAATTLGEDEVIGIALLDKEIEGVSGRDWVRNKTVELCKRGLFSDREFDRLSLSFTAEDKQQNESNSQMVWQYQARAQYEANGIGYKSFAAASNNAMREQRVRSALYGDGGEFAIPQAEKQEYFDTNYVRAEYMQLPVYDNIGFKLIESQPEALRAVADKLLEKAKADDSLLAAYLAHFGEALTLSGDDTAPTPENAAEVITSGFYGPNLGINATLLKTLLAAPIGEYGICESEDGTLFIYKRLPLEEKDTEASYDKGIVSELSKAPYDEYVADGTAGYPVVVDEKAATYYSPDKIKLS